METRGHAQGLAKKGRKDGIIASMTSKNKKLIIAFSVFLFLFFNWANADTLGQNVSFYVNSNFDRYERTDLSATLKHVSERLYFYVENSFWTELNSAGQLRLLNNISDLAIEFETNIYPKEVTSFGSESNPGIDKDPRITILLEELAEGNGGYFDTANGYTRKEISSSNERDMIVVSVRSVLAGLNFSKVFLAHEFQHLISFNQKDISKNVSEEVWLNELRSEYAISLVGYDQLFERSNLKHRFDAFIDSPSDSLTEWPNKNPDYAIANVFGQYLAEQFGNSIVLDTIKSDLIGIPSINEYLERSGYWERFEDVFGRWMVALYLNNQSQDTRFGFFNPSLKYVHVQPQQKINLTSNLLEYSATQSIKPWQPVWLEFNLDAISLDLSKSFKMLLNGGSGKIFHVFYLAFYNDGTHQFGRIPLNNSKGSVYILNSKKGLNKVLVMTTDGTKTIDFRSNEGSSLLTVSGSIIETKTAEAMTLRDGSLIKRPRESEVYVIWGKYKRYLSSGVIGLYGHLNPANVVEVEPELFDSYQTSNYVKYINEEKVYAVWPDSTKHWFNITPQQWDGSGRDWGAIFIINDLELNYYRIGQDIIR